MSSSFNPTEFIIGRALFAAWIKNRGSRSEIAQRPFSRNWEEFLEALGLQSGIERGDAERELRQLEANQWVCLKTIAHRPHLIDRVILPLAEEERWKTIFKFIPPSHEESRQIQDFPWHHTLQFIPESRLNLPFEELKQIDQFLKNRKSTTPMVPIKERSLQLFGDEKRLDLLSLSSLFKIDRLQLERDLCCQIIGSPLAWKRGPLQANERPVIVLENAATWQSYVRWNQEMALFSAVVYGEGNRFIEGVRSLSDLFQELHGAREVLYFGDLDRQGLVIPQEASRFAGDLGLPIIKPHLWSYRQLLQNGRKCPQPWRSSDGLPPPSFYDWIHPFEDQVEGLIKSGNRLAQESIGWEFISSLSPLKREDVEYDSR